jgi:iron-sulfur cluster insertion protein
MTLTLTVPPKVTDRAFARLAEINEAAGEAKALRIAVEGGGCSGFQYDIRLDDPTEDDVVLEGQGQKVVVDSVSLPFLADAVIDFTEELIGHDREPQRLVLLRLRHVILHVSLGAPAGRRGNDVQTTFNINGVKAMRLMRIATFNSTA